MARATILYAEGHAAVRLAVTESLESEGWRVDACADGVVALRLLESDARYELILLNNKVPGVGGLELVRRARSLAHLYYVLLLCAAFLLYHQQFSRVLRDARCWF